ncbi:MAG: YybH family protein [Planctomycetaceae bacterium]
MNDGSTRSKPGGLGLPAIAMAALLAALAAGAHARADQAKAPAAKPAAGAVAAPAAESPSAARAAAVTKAAADYAARFNERDVDGIARHWTAGAELVEGEGRLVGRDAIVRSIRAWLERHPKARLEIEVARVQFPADSLARVSGIMTFTSRDGAKPVLSRFVSLRVLEDGEWRIAESAVVPSQAAVLDELEWLVGTWKCEAARGGDEVEATFSRSLGDASIVGRTTIKPAEGKSREVLQVIHADRASGRVKTWIFDSSGARAEGVVDADGASYHQTLVGVPAETAGGGEARWTQVIAPTGEGRFTLHAIERSIDGVPLPDGRQMDFRKVR